MVEPCHPNQIKDEKRPSSEVNKAGFVLTCAQEESESEQVRGRNARLVVAREKAENGLFLGLALSQAFSCFSATKDLRRGSIFLRIGPVKSHLRTRMPV